jgi:superfamily I DNA and/or RNA helicase
MTDLNGGALFNAEFGIRHRGSTVPERSGVALSFCRRRVLADDHRSLPSANNKKGELSSPSFLPSDHQ